MATTHSLTHATVDPEVAGKRVLILGGGLWQREYVRRTKQLGAEVWVTDWSAEAVARLDADHFAPIDLRDREGTLEFARAARVDAVLTSADVGVPTAAYVADALGLPGSPPDLAERATNKFAMRQWAQMSGLACPWFARVESAEAAHEAVRHRECPVIVKPVDNCSSRGVEVVQRVSDLDASIARALAASVGGAALIEQFLRGEEGSIEAVVQDGAVTVLGICEKTKSPLPDRYDLELRYPGNYADPVRQALEDFARTLVRAFRITDAVIHIEFLLVGPGPEIYLVEFALRGCGSKVITHLMPELTGIDVVRAIVRQALGLTTPLLPTRSRHGILHFLMFPPGCIRRITGLDRARSVPGVIDVTIERDVGERVDRVHDGRSRPGHLLVCAPTAAAAQQIVQQVHDVIRLDYDDGRAVAPLPVGSAAT